MLGLGIARLLSAAFAVVATLSVLTTSANAITLSKSAHAFGDVFANFTSVSIPIDVTFTAGYTLSSVTLEGDTAQFTAPLNLCSIGAGSECTMNAVFQPIALGPFEATIKVTECLGTACNLETVYLTGTW